MRTPISGLKSAAELLLKWPEETSPERHEQILEMATQMEGIIESLLLLASWESGQSPNYRAETIAICAVVKRCWENESELANAKGLSYSCSYTEEREIKADPSLFRLIVANLISNAVQYTDENGSVLVREREEVSRGLRSQTRSKILIRLRYQILPGDSGGLTNQGATIITVDWGFRL